MLLNPYAIKKPPLISDIAAVKHWYDPTDPTNYYKVGSNLAYIYNKIDPSYQPLVNISGGGGAGYPEITGDKMIKNSGGQFLSTYAGSNNQSVKASTPTGTTEGWVFAFAYAEYDSINGNKFMFGYGNPSSGTSARMVGLSLTNDDFYYPMISVSGSGGGYLARKAVNHRSTEVLIAGRFVNGAIELWVNGELISTTNTSFNTPAASNVSMFKNPDYVYTDPPPPATSSFDFRGRVGNCVISAALTTEERQFIEGYICWVHGKPERLPNDHPNRYIDPR